MFREYHVPNQESLTRRRSGQHDIRSFIGNYILIQSWLFFHYYVLRQPCIRSNILITVEAIHVSTIFHRNGMIHIRSFLPRKLIILCIMFKIIVFFVITLFAMLFAKINILLRCEKRYAWPYNFTKRGG